MCERPQLDSDLMLEEAVTAARHTRSITLSGVDMPVRHPLVEQPTKKVTACRRFRKKQEVCTCHWGPYKHTLAADYKNDNLLLEICFGSRS